jgi:hypothetical protein
MLPGELFLPKNARSLRLCILKDETAVACRRIGSLLSNAQTATLTLRTDAPISLREVGTIVEWVRSRRLLGTLAIKIVAQSPRMMRTT